jgi:cytochrome c oxidase subunit 2
MALVKKGLFLGFVFGLLAVVAACQEGPIGPVDQTSALAHSADSSIGDEASKGSQLFVAKGCGDCHKTRDRVDVAPSLYGLYGSTSTVIVGTEKKTVAADDGYLTESIMHPDAKIVDGYKDIMPDYPELTSEQVSALVAYIKTLK